MENTYIFSRYHPYSGFRIFNSFSARKLELFFLPLRREIPRICPQRSNPATGPHTENRLEKLIRIWRALHEYVNFVHDPEKQYRSLSEWSAAGVQLLDLRLSAQSAPTAQCATDLTFVPLALWVETLWKATALKAFWRSMKNALTLSPKRVTVQVRPDHLPALPANEPPTQAKSMSSISLLRNSSPKLLGPRWTTRRPASR